ncbi:MAG: YARHG domain-containing protein [Treponema sp.]|jgi:hypothetical protein|nr:YARHG domain-containing protein [Treponema sp.]
MYNNPLLDYNSYPEFVSLGYNSLNRLGYDRDLVVNNSFINIDGYSHYIIGSSATFSGEIGYSITLLFEKEPGRWFELYIFSFLGTRLPYSRRYLENMTTDTDKKIFVEFEYNTTYNISDASEAERYEYKFNSENIIENIAEYSMAGYGITSGRIEKLDNGIMVYSKYSKETRRYYNIHEEELLDYFLKIFVEKIFFMFNPQRGISQLDEYRIDYERLYNNEEHTPVVIDILNNMTRRELAILRNCLYANHDYSFRSEKWISFFQKYYDANYQGIATEEEALNAFNRNEKWLLDIIIEIEKI